MEADIMENIDFILLIYYIWRLLLETLELDGQGRCSGKLQSKVLCSNVCAKSVKIQENSEKMGGGMKVLTKLKIPFFEKVLFF